MKIDLNKKYLIIIVLIIIIIAIVAVGANLLTNGEEGINPAAIGKNQIEVDANTPINGSMEVYVFRNVVENENGTINASQFDEYLPTQLGFSGSYGDKLDAQVVNGKATIELPEDTKYFYIGNYITDLDQDYGFSTDYHVTVKLVINGITKTSGTGDIYAAQANVDIGGLYSISGDKVKDSDIIADTPYSQAAW